MTDPWPFPTTESWSTDRPIDPNCPICDGDGYTERFNDDQSGLIIEPCACDYTCTGCGLDEFKCECEDKAHYD